MLAQDRGDREREPDSIGISFLPRQEDGSLRDGRYGGPGCDIWGVDGTIRGDERSSFLSPGAFTKEGEGRASGKKEGQGVV